MAKPGGFNQQAIGFALAQQGVEPDLHRQTVHAAHAAAGDLFEQRAAFRQQPAVNAHFTKLVDQHGPFFIRGLMGQQMQNRRRLAAAEKPRDQIGFGHFFSRINVML